MVLEGNNLFGDSQTVNIRLDEQRDLPSVGLGEFVLWRVLDGYGERNTSHNSASYFGLDASTDRAGQSFTVGHQGPAADLTMKGIQFKMYRVGSPGDIVCELFKCEYDSSNRPETAGSVLATGTTSCNGITTESTNGEWVTFTFSTPYLIINGTQYIASLRGASTSAGNEVRIKISLSQSYGDNAVDPLDQWEAGFGQNSTDSGANWAHPSGKDCAFRVLISGGVLLVNIDGSVQQVPTKDTGWNSA